MAGRPHQQRPDVDNYIKAVLDHLAPEDGYVWHVDAQKFWVENGAVEIKRGMDK